MIETITMPVISTAHLSYETGRRLDTTDVSQWPVCGMLGPYGWMLYCGEEAFDDDCPSDIKTVISWARSQKYEWVRLDQDADPIEGLKAYDW